MSGGFVSFLIRHTGDACRMLWSFSRDGGVPLHRVWGAINGVTGAPLNAAWAMTALAFLLGLPMLWSHTAFVAIGSMSALGLFISCEQPPPPVRSQSMSL